MTSRRNFLRNILVAGASFTILPGAGRVWMAQRVPFIGIREQLRYVPHYPHPLNLKEFMDQVLGLPARIRPLEIWTDPDTAERIRHYIHGT